VRGLVWLIALACVTPAHADEPEAPVEAPGPGWLELDPAFTANRGIGAVEEHDGVRLRLGPRTSVALDGSWWQNQDDRLSGADFRGAQIDVDERGWRAGLHVMHDFGFAQLVAGVSVSHVEHVFGRGRYATVSLALRKTWKLSRWTTLWLEIGGGVQSFFGERPETRQEAAAMTLRLGGTFR
jgi:hypothetical protein